MIPYDHWQPPRAAPITSTERRAGLVAWLAIAAVFLLLAATVAGCARRAYSPAETAAPGVAARLDTTSHRQLTTSDLRLKAGISGFAKLTDAVGLTTPEGRARRQAVRLARAGAGKVKIGKGGQYAPNAQQAVNNGNRTAAPATAAAPGASVNNAAANSQQQAVNGNDNELSAKQANPTQQAKDWRAVLAGPVGVAGAVLLALAGGYALYLLLPLLPRRKSNPPA